MKNQRLLPNLLAARATQEHSDMQKAVASVAFRLIEAGYDTDVLFTSATMGSIVAMSQPTPNCDPIHRMFLWFEQKGEVLKTYKVLPDGTEVLKDSKTINPRVDITFSEDNLDSGSGEPIEE